MKYQTEHHARADAILQMIAISESRIQEVERDATSAISGIKEEYSQKLAPVQDELGRLQKLLRDHMKQRRGVFFDGTDRVDLQNGALLYKLEQRVKRARGVLEKLEKNGFSDAVKIAKSVDWDALEKWPVERLMLVGTERVKKETFEYEIKGAGKKIGRAHVCTPVTQ